MPPMTVSPTDHAPGIAHKPTFSITPRIIAILAACDRFGFLSSEQIWQLDGGSKQKLTRILQKCTEAGLLVQPQGQRPVGIKFFDVRPRAFGLTKLGARVLSDAGVPVDLSLDRTSRNRRAVLLQHTIEVADAMFHFDAACAAHGSLRVIDQHHVRELLPAAARELRKPFSLSTRVLPSDFPHLAKIIKEPTDIAVEPDRLFLLARPDATGWSAALEVDRGHESVFAHRFKGKTSFARKQLAYYSAWRNAEITERWGDMCRAFRVLTITTSESRAKSMLTAQNQITRGAASGLFLYSTFDRMKAHGPLAPIWITSKKDNVSLLDRE
jgi:hypothetical protein